MTPEQGLGWICQNQGIVLGALAMIPIASALTWFTGLYNALPPWLQSVLHILAGNFLHAVADPPAPKP
jgi:hypothetical protein